MAKRISSTAISWSTIAEAVGAEGKPLFTTFKAKTDKVLRQIAGKPSELPKVDWNHYRSRITVPGLVDSYQKSYESLKIPYPNDQGLLAETEEQITKAMKMDEEMEKQLNAEIEKFKERLKVLESTIPYSKMSLEEFHLACPQYRYDPDNPKLWPQHLMDEQEKEDLRLQEEKKAAELAAQK